MVSASMALSLSIPSLAFAQEGDAADAVNADIAALSNGNAGDDPASIGVDAPNNVNGAQGQPSSDAPAPDQPDSSQSSPDNPDASTPTEAFTPDSVISVTVSLDKTTPSTPIDIPDPEGSLGAQAEDTTDSWEFPLTDNGYITSDGTVIENAVRKGIDVSEHQGHIDWEAVKSAGIDFAIIRCGYGEDEASQDDARWLYNVSECERLGIPYGVYIYSYANSIDKAASEARHVLRLLEGHNPAYPVYYDLEESSIGTYQNRALLAEMSITWCTAIAQGGYTPGIYANLYWWTHLLVDPVFENWERWVAQYNNECNYAGNYKIWQASSKGVIPGISSQYVDMNFEFGGEFRDVDYNDWYVISGALDYCVSHGILNGYEGTYNWKPFQNMTRAEVVSMFWKLEGRLPTAFAGVGNPDVNIMPFDDIDPNAWYAKAVSWARSVGIINGTSRAVEVEGEVSAVLAGAIKGGYEAGLESQNLFNPDACVTKEELCQMLASYAEFKGLSIDYNLTNLISKEDSSDVSGWARDSVGWALDSGIIDPERNGSMRLLNPDDNITRAVAAQMMYSLSNVIKEAEASALKEALEEGEVILPVAIGFANLYGNDHDMLLGVDRNAGAAETGTKDAMSEVEKASIELDMSASEAAEYATGSLPVVNGLNAQP